MLLHQFDLDVVRAVDEDNAAAVVERHRPHPDLDTLFGDVGEGLIEVVGDESDVVVALVASQFHGGKLAVRDGDLHGTDVDWNPSRAAALKGRVVGGTEELFVPVNRGVDVDGLVVDVVEGIVGHEKSFLYERPKVRKKGATVKGGGLVSQGVGEALEVVQTAGGDGARIWVKIEHFYGDIALIVQLLERPHDAGEVGVAKAGAALVGVVDVDVVEVLAGVAQKLGDGNFLGRAGAHIDHGLEVRVVDLGDHFARLGTGGDDVRLLFAQGLDAEIDAVLLG